MFSIPSTAKEKLNVVYFYSSKCLACKENTSFIKNLETLDGINLIKYNTNEEDCTTTQSAYAEHFGVSEIDSLKVPYIYFGDKSYELSPSIHAKVLNEINDYVSGNVDYENFKYDSDKCEKSPFEKFMEKMTVPGILLAGLIDGINPCAISMLMVFYSFLLMTENKKKIIIMSSMFIFGIFAANLTFGLGIKYFYNTFAGNGILLYALYGISIGMCLVAFILNTIDIINAKKNKEAKNQLPDRIKFKLSNILRNSIFSKFAAAVALLVGFLIGAVELACTGQIYFPTLTYMIQTTNYGFESIILLIGYNLMFVLPLIIITVIAAIIKEPEKVKTAVMKRNWLIKLVANIFFVIMIYILTKQILNI
jgi:cytochrome c biogenesis protein CcdA